MKVLITGGTGYIGTVLSWKLSERSEITEILVYDNLSKGHHNFFMGERFPNSKIKFIEGEILDSRRLKKQVDACDVVVHLAAKVTTPFSNTDPHFFEQVNHWGTAEVVYAAEEYPIDKFIYLSSTAVYGASKAVATEDTHPNPRTFYGVSKMRGEEHVDRLKELKNAIVLRGGNVYGPSRSMRFDAVIYKFMFEANFNNRIQIFGSGKQSRAFIHVDYLVECITNTILQEVPSGTYNVVDKNLQILDILDVLKELYPNLEFMFTNQHMNLRELRVDRTSKLFDYIPRWEENDFKTELTTFKQRFSF